MSKKASAKGSSKKVKVTAVVVTYQPDFELLFENIDKTYKQVEELVIVDNGSKNQAELRQLIADKKSTYTNLSLVCLDENTGLGYAHNQGIHKAKELNSEYVLLLDQDSQPQQGMVESLYRASKELTKEAEQSGFLKPLAAVGPSYLGEGHAESFFIRFGVLKFERTYCSSCAPNSNGIVLADFLISSGSLISMQAIDAIGLMDEGLFIDHVDTEWFLRAKKKGYQSYGVCSAVMQHGLGEQTRKVKLFGFGRERNVPQHKPFRYYYMFRNSIQLYKQGYSKKWMWNDFQRLMQIFVFYGICYGPRLKNLSMMFKGIKDGLLGRSGKVDF